MSYIKKMFLVLFVAVIGMVAMPQEAKSLPGESYYECGMPGSGNFTMHWGYKWQDGSGNWNQDYKIAGWKGGVYGECYLRNGAVISVEPAGWGGFWPKEAMTWFTNGDVINFNDNEICNNTNEVVSVNLFELTSGKSLKVNIVVDPNQSLNVSKLVEETNGLYFMQLFQNDRLVQQLSFMYSPNQLFVGGK